MTAATQRSAYPRPVDDLLPRAVELAEQIGEVPSLRRLIAELKIGAPKARALAARIAEHRREQGTTGPLTDTEVKAAAIVNSIDLPNTDTTEQPATPVAEQTVTPVAEQPIEAPAAQPAA